LIFDVVFLGRHVRSHPHRNRFNMESCWHVKEKPTHHTKTGKEKQCKPIKQPKPQTVL